jgi:hypothetical protein
MLFKKIIPVYGENIMKTIIQNADLLVVKAGGCHLDLKANLLKCLNEPSYTSVETFNRIL